VRVYEISAQNRIMSVSENWDGFALANTGEGALSATVRGRPIWDFVGGLETRSYLNALFFAARRHRARVAVRYRGDGPTERRVYQLQIEPQGEEDLRLLHIPLDIARRFCRAPSAEELARLSCCSQCLRWGRGAAWDDSDLFHGHAPGKVDFAICPACRIAAQRAIDQALSSRQVH